MKALRRMALALAVLPSIASPSLVSRAFAETPAACPSAGREKIVLSGVETRLELRLADGRLLRLAGFDPARATSTGPTRADDAQSALQAQLEGQPLSVTLLSSSPDRWGRFAALVFAGGDQSGGLAATLIASGQGRYLSEPAAHTCRTVFVGAEEAARTQKLGLWADPYYAVLAADDHAGFAERAGTLVLAEGRVARIETGSYRTKLILAEQAGAMQAGGSPSDGLKSRGSYGGHRLAATLLPRTTKIFEANGVRISSLAGQVLRVRGLLDLRFGPEIELTNPDDIDLVSAEPAAPVKSAGTK